jgi:hypothetical protein
MINHEYLKEILLYHPETGIFTWKVKKSKKTKIGSVAGTNNAGYVHIRIDEKKHFAHRLAWFYQTGSVAPYMIDHINGNKSDNRWTNLRRATRNENSRNRSRSKTNTSGFKGVCWDKKAGKWKAAICVNNVSYHLGYFESPREASAVYEAVAKKSFGAFYKETM